MAWVRNQSPNKEASGGTRVEPDKNQLLKLGCWRVNPNWSSLFRKVWSLVMAVFFLLMIVFWEVKKDYYPCFEIVIIFKQITMKISSNLRGFFVALHFYPWIIFLRFWTHEISVGFHEHKLLVFIPSLRPNKITWKWMLGVPNRLYQFGW